MSEKTEYPKVVITPLSGGTVRYDKVFSVLDEAALRENLKGVVERDAAKYAQFCRQVGFGVE